MNVIQLKQEFDQLEKKFDLVHDKLIHYNKNTQDIKTSIESNNELIKSNRLNINDLYKKELFGDIKAKDGIFDNLHVKERYTVMQEETLISKTFTETSGLIMYTLGDSCVGKSAAGYEDVYPFILNIDLNFKPNELIVIENEGVYEVLKQIGDKVVINSRSKEDFTQKQLKNQMCKVFKANVTVIKGNMICNGNITPFKFKELGNLLHVSGLKPKFENKTFFYNTFLSDIKTTFISSKASEHNIVLTLPHGKFGMTKKLISVKILTDIDLKLNDIIIKFTKKDQVVKLIHNGLEWVLLYKLRIQT